MQKKDNQYQRKARYNPNRETYVDENGNYVYLIWDEERQDYRREVIAIGEGGITPELRAMLDEMDAEEERRLDVDDHYIDKVFEIKNGCIPGWTAIIRCPTPTIQPFFAMPYMRAS